MLKKIGKSIVSMPARASAAGTALVISTMSVPAHADTGGFDTALASWDPTGFAQTAGGKLVALAILLAGIYLVVKLVRRGH